jgi:hypothetical protein
MKYVYAIQIAYAFAYARRRLPLVFISRAWAFEKVQLHGVKQAVCGKRPFLPNDFFLFSTLNSTA